MTPWDVLGWLIVAFVAVVGLVFMVALVAALVRSLKKQRPTRIYPSNRSE